jgi:hypothetical protein
VVKLDGKYGALDDFAQIVIEPRFEKLGDFKNGFAYFIAAGRYGFVSETGIIFPAEFDWISDFSEQGIALIKQQNKFGLINTAGEIVLAPAYELVQKAAGQVYIVAQNNLYGFYSTAGCFITPVVYDYTRENPPEYYTNGIYFKIIKKGIGLVNGNGVMVVNPGSFDEISFPSSGRVLARKKKLYGYLDTLFNQNIPFTFDFAADFKDSLAIVKKKNHYLLIKTDGKPVFESVSFLKRLSHDYYLLEGPENEIINRSGEVIHTGIEKIEESEGHLLLHLSNGEIKLLSG